MVKHAALQAEVPAIKKLRSDHDHDDLTCHVKGASFFPRVNKINRGKKHILCNFFGFDFPLSDFYIFVEGRCLFSIPASFFEGVFAFD